MYKIDSYLIPLDEVLSILSRLKAKSIFLEAPPGVRDLAFMLSSLIEDNVDVSIYHSGRFTWGFCDVGINDAKLLGVDAILHVGHVNPLRYCSGRGVHIENISSIPVIYMPFYYNIEAPEDAITDVCRVLSKYVYVAYPVNYEITALQILKHLPRDVSYEANVMTGCYINAMDKLDMYDQILVVAGGFFHALTFKILNSNLKVLNYDPHRGKLYDVENYFRRIYALKVDSIRKCLNAKSFAIILVNKPGQYNLKLARDVKKLLQENNFKSIIVCTDEVSNNLISLYPNIDVFINTGCPRLAFDNIDQYEKPLINPGEVKTIITGRLNSYSLKLLLNNSITI
ncbi:MAG: diphthamide synthesis protein [Candidatus Methanomethylicia archaeon]